MTYFCPKQVKVVNEEVRFELVSNMVLNNTQLVTVKYDNRNIWHVVSNSINFLLCLP